MVVFLVFRLRATYLSVTRDMQTELITSNLILGLIFSLFVFPPDDEENSGDAEVGYGQTVNVVYVLPYTKLAIIIASRLLGMS